MGLGEFLKEYNTNGIAVGARGVLCKIANQQGIIIDIITDINPHIQNSVYSEALEETCVDEILRVVDTLLKERENIDD